MQKSPTLGRSTTNCYLTPPFTLQFLLLIFKVRMSYLIRLKYLLVLTNSGMLTINGCDLSKVANNIVQPFVDSMHIM
jgi:hypothetical protein